MLTPLDIENKKFSKQMVNGYSVEEVDDFLDELTKDYGKAYKESTEAKKTIDEFGRIDVLINNAGFGISGAVDFTRTEDAECQFNVNFFGAVRMCGAVLPIMRKQGFGRIVNIGSVAGDIAIPFQSFYSAAKAALCSYTLALINEVREFNITAVCIEPGDIRTGFTAARNKNTQGDDIYNGRISRSVEKMEKDEQTGMLPETAGKYIAKIASKQSGKPVLIIGAQYKAVGILKKILPLRLINRIVGAIYAK